MRGTNKDETGWVDVAAYAAITLNKKNNKVIIMTPEQRASMTNQQVEILRQHRTKTA